MCKTDNDITLVVDSLQYHKRIMLALRMLLCLKPLVIFKDNEINYSISNKQENGDTKRIK